MNRYNTLSLTLSVICFATVWSINENILSLLVITGKPDIIWWVKTISAIGIFAFLFQLFMWISQIVAKKWLSEEAKIIGEWYQVFQIHNYSKAESMIDAIRHGPVSIAFYGQLLEISATNMKVNQTAAPSSWHSNKVSLQGTQIWLLFSSIGPGRGSTHGNMFFHFEGNNPNKLTGQFSDSSPATHFGSIELYRDNKEYKERLKQLIDANSQ